MHRLFCCLCFFCLGSLLLLTACDGVGSREKTTLAETVPAETPPDTGMVDVPAADPAADILTVREGYLYNGQGKKVILHGVNLGGWLLQESWMCPVDGSDCHLDSLTLLTERFGTEKAEALFASYVENYITREDVQRIAALGCNCVRLPFWYRNFMNEDGTFLTDDPDENPGFRAVDRLIGWCRDEGVYVILDMHGAPGGQSTNHCTGGIGRWELFTSPAAREAAGRLWEAIARRYRDEPTVAAYDLLNEPMNNDAPAPAAGSPQAVSMTVEMYDYLYKCIRAVDTRHPITVEGVWSGDCLPDPASLGWENMIYQLHLYDSAKSMIDYRVNELKTLRDKYGVAVYVGEFNNSDENQTYAYRAYRAASLSRTMWNYKVGRGDLGNWGVYATSRPAADLANDPYEVLLEKWGEALRTEHYTENKTVAGWLKQYSR